MKKRLILIISLFGFIIPFLFADGVENGYNYVDLGLSVKWATCNVGANSPTEYGEYYAWGEVDSHDIYAWFTYKYCEGSSSTIIKYNLQLSKGNTIDKRTCLDESDDVAHVKWGGSWRIPTYDEVKELQESCTWNWTTLNGVNGYKIISKINSNSIFLPAAGYRYMDKNQNVGLHGYYWTSSLDQSNSCDAHFLYITTKRIKITTDSRDCGQSIRPVCP